MTTLKWCSGCDEAAPTDEAGECKQCGNIIDPVAAAAFDDAQIVENNWRPCITWDLAHGTGSYGMGGS